MVFNPRQEYSYKPNSRIKAPAQVAGEICAELAENGELTPKRLLDVSREESAPLHGEFEWDDGIAAEKYRENQAGHIIRCLIVKPVEDKELVRAFVRVSQKNGDYTPIQTAISRPDYSTALLKQAYQDMERFVHKYKNLAELTSVVNNMQDALNRPIRKAVSSWHDDRASTLTTSTI